MTAVAVSEVSAGDVSAGEVSVGGVSAGEVSVGEVSVREVSVREVAGDSVRRTTLPSGLRVVTESLAGVRSASVGFWLDVGSRDESTANFGAAHYLEHLLFKGTARRTSVQIAEEIDGVGGELNAFTAKEHTCYYAHVLDEDLALAVDVLADVVTGANLAAADVELERSVVLDEIAMRDDDPEDMVGELFDRALFGDHPLGRPVIGTEASIRAMRRSGLQRFYRSRYTMPRMVVAAAGNLSHERVVELLAAAFGPTHAAGNGSAAEPAAPRAGHARLGRGTEQVVLGTHDGEQAHLMLGVAALDRHDPRRYALAVLNTAMGGGMSSRLFQQVREQRGLAYSVYSATSSYADAGSVVIYAGCQPDRLDEVVAVVLDVVRAAARDGLTDAEVARAKGSLRGGLVLGLEDTASRMQRLGSAELDHGRQRSVQQSLDSIDAVTGAEVSEVAAELLHRPLTAAVVGPFGGLGELPAALRDAVGAR